MSHIKVSKELLEEIIKRITQKVEVEKIIIFGSSVREDGSKKSDIDIALLGVNNLSKIPELHLELNEELPTLRDIDLVVFDTLKNEKLKQRILSEGVVIYERSSSRQT